MSRALSDAFIAALTAESCELFYAVELLFDDADGTLYSDDVYAGERAVRLWTGYGDRLIDGKVYSGAANLIGIDLPPETSDLSAQGATVTLSGASTELISLALQENYVGRRARVRLGAKVSTAVADPASAYRVDGVSPLLTLDFSNDVYAEGSDDPLEAYAIDGTEPLLVLDFASGVYHATSALEAPAATYATVEIFAGIMNRMTPTDDGADSAISLEIESLHVMLQRANVRRYTSSSHKSRYAGDTFFDFIPSLVDKEIAWGRKG